MLSKRNKLWIVEENEMRKNKKNVAVPSLLKLCKKLDRQIPELAM